MNRFEKDLKQMQKRGKDIGKFKTVALKLMAGEVLEPRYCDHPLVGNFANRRDCHNTMQFEWDEHKISSINKNTALILKRLEQYLMTR